MRTMIRIIAVAALLFAAAGAFAQNGDTLNIGGQVPLTLTLTVAADADADNLILLGAGSVNAPIAEIGISTNNTDGWELWVFSANAAGATTALINADGDPIPYTITYGGAGGVTAEDLDDDGVKVGESATNDAQVAQVLSIDYLQSAHPAGYYSDQLAIVLRAK